MNLWNFSWMIWASIFVSLFIGVMLDINAKIEGIHAILQENSTIQSKDMQDEASEH